MADVATAHESSGEMETTVIDQPQQSTPEATPQESPEQQQRQAVVEQRAQQFQQTETQYRELQQNSPDSYKNQEAVKTGTFAALSKDAQTNQNFNLSQEYIAQIQEYFKDSPATVVQEHVDKVRHLMRFAAEQNLPPEAFEELNGLLEENDLESFVAECKKKFPSFADSADSDLDAAMASNGEFWDNTEKPFDPDHEPNNDPEVTYTKIIENAVGKKALEAYFDQKNGVRALPPEGSEERVEAVNEFIAFYKQFLADLKNDKDFAQNKKSFFEKGKAAGIHFAKEGVASSDPMELIRTLLIQYDSRHSGHSSYLDSHERGSGKGIYLREFQELCKWSNNSENTETNKRDWMFLCALIYHNLESPGTSPTDTLEEWQVNPAQFSGNDYSPPDFSLIKDKMFKLYAKCLEGEPSKINTALKATLESDVYKNSINSGVAITDVSITPDLLTVFQMLGENSKYGRTFFGD